MKKAKVEEILKPIKRTEVCSNISGGITKSSSTAAVVVILNEKSNEHLSIFLATSRGLLLQPAVFAARLGLWSLRKAGSMGLESTEPTPRLPASDTTVQPGPGASASSQPAAGFPLLTSSACHGAGPWPQCHQMGCMPRTIKTSCVSKVSP